LCVYGRKIEVQTTVVCCDKATVPQNTRSRRNTSGTEQKSVGYMMPLREANSQNVKQASANRILIITVFKCQLAVFGRLRRIVKSDRQLRHVRPPVCPHGTRLPLDEFSRHSLLEDFL